MAEIWKAKVSGAAGFEKSVAIKRVLPHLAEDREFVEMFVQEAKLVAGLVHPNIVQVFDFGQIDDSYFLAMEFVPGCNVDKLERRLDERHIKLSAPVALYIAAETCKGLGFAHALTDAKGVSRNLVHRDVSPQNVLLSFAGDVKVGDFGIAKAVHLRSRTETGLVRGKSAYMSPEQSRGEPLDQRSDLFSVGIMLYEMVAGRRLFDGTSTLDVMQKVAAWQGPSAEALSAVPPSLHELFETALAGPREKRFPDAVAMETAISWHLADGAVRARQSLGALVREIFADEAQREQADAGESAADAAATLDGPAVVVPGADSQAATVQRAPFGGIADSRRGESATWRYAAIAVVTTLLGISLVERYATSEKAADAAASPAATALAVATSSAGVLATTGNATSWDFTIDARVDALRERMRSKGDLPGFPKDDVLVELEKAQAAVAGHDASAATAALDSAERRIVDAGF